MLSTLLRIISFACCAFVLASFAMFTYDQLSSASEHQQRALAVQAGQAAHAGQPVARPPHQAHAQPRRFIDDVAGKLTHPFRSLIHSRSAWVLELFSLVLALLFYGFLLRFLARFASGSRRGVLLKPV